LDNVVDVLSLARQTAEIIPPPPDPGDTSGYLAWRELVWRTAIRLGELGGAAVRRWAVPEDRLDPACAVTAEALLQLAASLMPSSAVPADGSVPRSAAQG
jgi:hypothetical protein